MVGLEAPIPALGVLGFEAPGTQEEEEEDDDDDDDGNGNDNVVDDDDDDDDDEKDGVEEQLNIVL